MAHDHDHEPLKGEVLTAAAGLEVPGVQRSFPRFVAAWNERQGLGTPALHGRVAGWLEQRWVAGDRQLLLMVFRDAGKSTLVGLFCAWLLLRDPDVRILVVSADHLLACKMTRNVRGVLVRHPWTGHLKPKRAELWAADQLTIERNLNLRDPSLLARGITSNITGSRADVVICDDVEVPLTCDTPPKRTALRERLAEIAYVLVPGGTQLYVGTPHTYYSIYADAARSEAGETAPFLDGFARLVLPIVDDLGCSRWPERFTDQHIERLKRTTGPTKFASQMMLRPAHAHEIRLDPDRLLPYEAELDRHAANGRSWRTLAGRPIAASLAWWDPAFGKPGAGDASVLALVLVDGERHYWLHALHYLTVRDDDPRGAARQQCAAVAAVLHDHGETRVVVETNGLGRFLPDTLREVLAAQRSPAVVVEHVNSVPKDRRILEALDAPLADGRLHAHRRVLATVFPQEMREWRPGGGCRDDALDALAGAVVALPAPIAAPGRQGRGPVPSRVGPTVVVASGTVG